MLILSFAWTALKMILVLKQSKTIHRDLRCKEEALREQKKEEDELNDEEDIGLCDKVLRFFSSLGQKLMLTLRFDVIPVVKALPSVLFRVSVLWLILSYSSEAYPNENGDGPSLLLALIPSGMLLLIISLNYVAANKIKLRKKEALVNSVSNVILPVYVDVFHLVS